MPYDYSVSLIRNEGVVGSNPTSGTININNLDDQTAAS